MFKNFSNSDTRFLNVAAKAMEQELYNRKTIPGYVPQPMFVGVKPLTDERLQDAKQKLKSRREKNEVTLAKGLAADWQKLKAENDKQIKESAEKARQWAKEIREETERKKAARVQEDSVWCA